MTIRILDELAGLVIIRLSDLDFQEQDVVSQIKNKLGHVADSVNTSQLLIDFENVSFLSSAAIGQLIMLKKKCDQKQVALALCNISEKNMKVLRLVRFDELVNILDDQPSAIESLQAAHVPTPKITLSDREVIDLKERARIGEVSAMLELAQRKADGNGMDQDAADAMKWYLAAAQKGHRQAQYELATCYAFGLGVRQDYGLAMPWYKRAADLGHADAQYMMGMSFQYALDDTIDLSAARKWYQLASEQEHDKSTSALQELPD